MDTSELTVAAYETIGLADEVCDCLRSDIGISASDFETEDDFLAGTLELLDEILEDPSDYLDSWNLIEDVPLPSFEKGIRQLRAHVEKTLATPLEQRGGIEE